ncbi:unnamed protein product [Effrenium voratum]|uniref:Uncharacterized protein n=1 Tax=Effrenium voratum TaxID=2562239 RepID=A0AA36IPX8_9DINO|nr:unnamed protein product [Effrenium voratum]
MGNQPMSPRPSAPAGLTEWPAGLTSEEFLGCDIKHQTNSPRECGVLSTIASPPGVGVAKSTRDQAARTALFVSDADRTAVSRQPKPNFSVDLPATSRVSRPGL